MSLMLKLQYTTDSIAIDSWCRSWIISYEFDKVLIVKLLIWITSSPSSYVSPEVKSTL